MRAALVSALVLAISLPCGAFTATPHPASEKYRDNGAHPATGRSGNAAVQTRALKAKDGGIAVEVTTGQFDPPAAPLGTLAKVQVKVLNDAGDVLLTDNYKKSLTGLGTATFFYDNLMRHQRLQLQSSVTGIDPNRTDVVTTDDRVQLLPDPRALAISAPDQARVDTPVTIIGSIAERNGDVGARATCRLLVDNVEVAALPGIWIDANSLVSCRFDTTFSTAGSKQLAVKVTDVAPADYDDSNNTATRSLLVTSATEPFTQIYGYINNNRWNEMFYWSRTASHSDGSLAGYSEGRTTSIGGYQSIAIYGWFNDFTPTASGTLSLTQTLDGAPLPSITVDIATLTEVWTDPNGTYWYRWGPVAGTNAFVQADSAAFGQTYFSISQFNSDALYYWSTSGWGVFGYWDDSGSSSYQIGDPLMPWPIQVGTVYHGELSYTNGGSAHGGALDVVVTVDTLYDYDQPLNCFNYWDYYYSLFFSDCYENHIHDGTIFGYGSMI